MAARSAAKDPPGLPEGLNQAAYCLMRLISPATLLQRLQRALIGSQEVEVPSISARALSEVHLQSGYLPRQRSEQAPPIAHPKLALVHIHVFTDKPAVVQNLVHSLAIVIVHRILQSFPAGLPPSHGERDTGVSTLFPTAGVRATARPCCRALRGEGYPPPSIYKGEGTPLPLFDFLHDPRVSCRMGGPEREPVAVLGLEESLELLVVDISRTLAPSRGIIDGRLCRLLSGR